MLADEIPKSLDEFFWLASHQPANQSALLEALLEHPSLFDRLVSDNSDFRLLLKRFPKQSEALLSRLFQPDVFRRLIRNSYDFNFTLGIVPLQASLFFSYIDHHQLVPRLFYQYPQLRNTAARWPLFRLPLLDMALRDQQHLLTLFIYHCHFAEALQRFPERRANLITIVLNDWPRTSRLIETEEHFQQLVPSCRGLHPAFDATNVTEFYEYFQQVRRTQQEIGKNARLLACLKVKAYSRFSNLPEEILVKIAAETTNSRFVTKQKALAVAEDAFQRPPAPR